MPSRCGAAPRNAFLGTRACIQIAYGQPTPRADHGRSTRDRAGHVRQPRVGTGARYGHSSTVRVGARGRAGCLRRGVSDSQPGSPLVWRGCLVSQLPAGDRSPVGAGPRGRLAVGQRDAHLACRCALRGGVVGRRAVRRGRLDLGRRAGRTAGCGSDRHADALPVAGLPDGTGGGDPPGAVPLHRRRSSGRVFASTTIGARAAMPWRASSARWRRCCSDWP